VRDALNLGLDASLANMWYWKRIWEKAKQDKSRKNSQRVLHKYVIFLMLNHLLFKVEPKYAWSYTSSSPEFSCLGSFQNRDNFTSFTEVILSSFISIYIKAYKCIYVEVSGLLMPHPANGTPYSCQIVICTDYPYDTAQKFGCYKLNNSSIELYLKSMFVFSCVQNCSDKFKRKKW
jgi:hypothetical protein